MVVEPKFHVTARAFEGIVNAARHAGLEPVKEVAGGLEPGAGSLPGQRREAAVMHRKRSVRADAGPAGHRETSK